MARALMMDPNVSSGADHDSERDTGHDREATGTEHDAQKPKSSDAGSEDDVFDHNTPPVGTKEAPNNLEAGEAVMTSSQSSSEDKLATSTRKTRLASLYVTLTPRRCRWDPEHPPIFTTAMNILFGFAGCFTVANLYYNQPILAVLSRDFNVSYETASRVPTLAQAGYCLGLFLLCPLGDLLPRRPYTLCLIFFTAACWIGLCVTKSFLTFQILSFITGFSTVTPQIMLPLVADLAPPERRAQALSWIVSGNGIGILLARILSGVVANYIDWHYIYWIAFGLQCLILILLYLFMPEYPRTNTSSAALPYHRLLWDVLRLPFIHPVLAQSSVVSFCTSSAFTSFWTTLTFLLSSPPYQYSSLIIGLFALIGLVGIVASPIYARTFIDKHVPLFSALIGQFVALAGVLVGTFTGTFTVAGPAIYALLLDAGFQITNISLRSAIYSCLPKGRNRVNTTFMVSSFLGQVAGTAAGNKLYAQSGWHASGGLSVGLLGFSVCLLLLRGPYETRWIGWRGGASMRKRDPKSADGRRSEVEKVVEVKADGSEIDAVVDEKSNRERALDEAATVEEGGAGSADGVSEAERQVNGDGVRNRHSRDVTA